MIKQVLAQARPNTWPSSMIELTPEQIHNQANDTEEAREVIAQREHLRGLCNNFSEDSFDYGDHENTEQDRLYDDYLASLALPQGRYMRREDDPFREDTITRSIESSPPSPDDMRMSEKSFQFMVSTLVVLLNVHWWAHAGSYFMKSRSTNTIVYVDIYFPEIASLGQTSIAPAYSLEPSDENSQTSRKRMASLACNLTNRQEIAGPLAALYLLRESCCYFSATCVNLPLDSMLEQLMCKDPYPCNLTVTETSGITDHQVQVASALDDYIFRPLKLEALSVYEFWMKFFRSKRGVSTRDDSTHRVGSRRKQIVPSISGARMPLVDDNTLINVRAKRSRIALVLFKPFRSIENLQGGDKSSDDDRKAAYADWEPRQTSFTRTIIGNMDDYFKGCSSKPKEVEGTISDSDEENNSEADSIEWETDEQMDPFADTTSMNGDSPDDNESERGEIEMLETDLLDPVHFPSSPNPMIT
ncbi:hypothetical protein GQ600_18535 [Phytophthora cactorum]|nr:hypothetical protein GQ600_18535 [Phytophthora cactorum]